MFFFYIDAKSKYIISILHKQMFAMNVKIFCFFLRMVYKETNVYCLFLGEPRKF